MKSTPSATLTKPGRLAREGGQFKDEVWLKVSAQMDATIVAFLDEDMEDATDVL